MSVRTVVSGHTCMCNLRRAAKYCDVNKLDVSFKEKEKDESTK